MLLKVEHLVVSPAGFALRTGKLAFVLLAIMDIRALRSHSAKGPEAPVGSPDHGPAILSMPVFPASNVMFRISVASA
jgi:hypothetical protein